MAPFEGQSVYVSGKFEGVDKGEVWAWLLGLGAYGCTSKSAARAYLCADASDPKLVATGRPVYTLADLGAPLQGYLGRLREAVAERRAEFARYRNQGTVAHLGAGPPADEALIASVTEAVGGRLPEELGALMRQFNGLSCVVATLKGPGGLDLPDGEPLPYGALVDSDHPLWRGRVDWLLGVIGIPRWEDIFLRPPQRRMCYREGPYGPKETFKAGALKVKAADFYPNLYTFDLYHPFGGAALYIDPKDGSASVLHAFDAWADLSSAHPLGLRAYMESLVAGIWHRVSHAGQRPIRPLSRTAWPTFIKNLHGAPYIFVELK